MDTSKTRSNKCIFTVIILISVLGLQACNDSSEITENGTSSVNKLISDYNLKGTNDPNQQTVASFNNIDSARIFLEKIKNQGFNKNQMTKNLRYKVSSNEGPRVTTASATINNNSKTKVCVAIVKNVLPYFPGANFKVTVDYSIDPPKIKSEITGVTWGFKYDADSEKATYKDGVISFGIEANTEWSVGVQGLKFEYSQPSSTTGTINLNSCTGSMTTTCY